MKYSTSFICLVLALLGGWIFLAAYYQELTFPFYPLIDTRLPSGFSQAKFESIQLGMTKTEILKILPAPVPRKEYKEEWSIDDDTWYYGQDGACLFGDFAWFEFVIFFDEEGKVSGKYYDIHRN
jgi:outer membrane protein assembly factor BamE (lipoprotein component of BamABCDE complex)